MLTGFILAITISMPLDSNTHLLRISEYLYTGPKAEETCNWNRNQNLNTKVAPGDSLKVGQCRKVLL